MVSGGRCDRRLAGYVPAMAEARPGDEIDERLSDEADAMEARIDELGDDIDEAKDKAKARAEDAQPLVDAAGDWEDERPDRPGGDDPEGAVGDDPEAALYGEDEGSGSPSPAEDDAPARTDDT